MSGASHLRNGGMYEGIRGNATDDNRVWIGSRNGITFGRWDGNNPMVLAAKPLEESRYYVVAGRMEAGTGEVQIELFIKEPSAVASKAFPVNPAANSSKLAIGQEHQRREEEVKLLAAIKAALPRLEQMWQQANSHWGLRRSRVSVRPPKLQGLPPPGRHRRNRQSPARLGSASTASDDTTTSDMT